MSLNVLPIYLGTQSLALVTDSCLCVCVFVFLFCCLDTDASSRKCHSGKHDWELH